MNKNESYKNVHQGFTMLELLISITLSGLVMASVFSIYITMGRVNNSTEELIQAQESAKAALQIMKRYIQSAGYGNAPLPAARIFGITTANADRIVFSFDKNNDGDTVAPDADEIFEFALTTTAPKNLTFTIGNGTPQIIIGNVNNLIFEYYNANDVQTAVLTEIRYVRIQVEVQTKTQDRNESGGGMGYLSRKLETMILCRNLGL
ncbi:MAG: prepilin-type N-terminal cleavage/methylation domain-containing protein [Desulfobacterales bacterium]|nr:prepilin-type N-terminal cleavage/methylation domain-containing protein [Desulfobacterales bacterium]